MQANNIINEVVNAYFNIADHNYTTDLYNGLTSAEQIQVQDAIVSSEQHQSDVKFYGLPATFKPFANA